MVARLRFYAAIWPRGSHSSAEIAMHTKWKSRAKSLPG
jgi:hypothetical protein